MIRYRECPDIDSLFEKALRSWMEEHADEIGSDLDRAEEAIPEVYERFIAEPCEALGWKSPLAYFEEETDADSLVGWMNEYFDLGIPIPDLLTERIVDLGKPAETALLALFRDPGTARELRMICISMLRELESALPMQEYADLAAHTQENDELAEAAAESLAYMGGEAVECVLTTLETATEAGKDLLCGILAGAPYDERITAFLRERFCRHPENRALYASYLAKYGDEGALPMLEQAAEEPDINYLDFIELSNAIEQLGGERPPMREFSGDPYYESLKDL